MFQTLTIRYETLEQFDEEFRSNLAQGGAFIPTVLEFQLREVVDIDLELVFLDQTVPLQAEVVSQLPPDLTPAGGVAGIAVQFLVPAEDLRLKLCELTGVDEPEPPPPTWAGRPEGPVRRHKRTPTRIATEVERGGDRIAGEAKNLSLSGALIAVDGDGPPLPVGDSVRVRMQHPVTGDSVLVSGEVVRHVDQPSGPSAMAVRFDEDDSTQAKIAEMEAAAHAQRLGGISGAIDALGLPNLCQMFSTSSAEGTLHLRRESFEGRILFQQGGMRHAQLGPVSGAKALARLLTWQVGEFEFYPTIANGEPEHLPIPMDHVMLAALQHVDELERLDLSSLPPNAIVSAVEGGSDEELEKLETALFDLAALELPVQEMIDARSEFDSEIYEALISLREKGRVTIGPKAEGAKAGR